VAPPADIVCESDSLETVSLNEELSFAHWQQDIPKEYWDLGAPEIIERIRVARERLGSRCIVLGHHYQREDIIRFADYRGDSLKLSQWAADHEEADYTVFCGVHFMAEAADILSAPHQQVVLPNLAAGCSMADMAEPEDVYAAWEELEEAGVAREIVPITYINSAASLKAFVGKHGGAVCTSSNARKVLEWAFRQNRRVFFFPDQHLGRNTALKMDIPLDEMPLWDYTKPFGSLGGMSDADRQRGRVLLWWGHCSVHQRFTKEQIEGARERLPDVKIVVHSECRMDVVEAADYDGSTELIVRKVTESPPGSVWGVGTEINLVSRLAKEHPDKTVFCLDPVVCPCSTMYRVHPAYLCWAVESLARDEVVNRIVVPDEEKRWAKVALDRMLQIV
jgi:quinolinate synthase